MLRLFRHPWSEPSQEITTALTGPTTFAKDSGNFKAATTNLNVVSLFFHKTPPHDQIKPCITDVNFGQRHEEGHHAWHHSLNEQTFHFHIFKNGYELITPSELECIFKNYKQHDANQNKCLDGKKRCTITDNDAQRVLGEYRRYYEANPEIQAQWQKQMQDAYADSVKKVSYSLLGIFLKSFTATFSQLYILPYLIQEGYSAQKIKTTLNTINSALSLTLSFSPEKILMEFIIHQLLEATHSHLFKNPNPITQQILSNVVIPLENILVTLSLFSKATSENTALIGAEMIVAQLGSMTGVGLVQLLPKLRKEEPTSNTGKAPLTQDKPNLPPTMRKRR